MTPLSRDEKFARSSEWLWQIPMLWWRFYRWRWGGWQMAEAHFHRWAWGYADLDRVP